MDRSIDIPLPALIIIVVLLLIVVAALLQSVDVSHRTVTQSNESLSITLSYPSRLRVTRNSYLQIDLANESAQVLEDVTVSFDAAYFEGLSQVDFVPAATRPWVVEYPRLTPGERQRIHISLEASAYWTQAGSLTLAATGVAPQRLEFSTFVIP